MLASLFRRSAFLFAFTASGLIAQDRPAASSAPATGSSPAVEQSQPEPETFAQALAAKGIKLVHSPATVKLGGVADLKLPDGFFAIDPGSLKKFYEFTHNSISDRAVGVIIAPGDWMLFFDYDESGYVKDEEKNSLDAGKLMKSMTANQDAANEERTKRGWDEMKVAGWSSEPHYDAKTHNLKWAIKLTSSRDNHKSYWINESIRLLGRGGVMEVTLVTNNETFTTDSAAADSLLAQSYTYVSGQRYAEFKQGDKMAEYGLAALVLGGAGAVAFKMGFLQKFGKLIVYAVVGLGGAIAKFWNKITGRNPRS